jgi:hypothetical protein
MTKIAAIVAIVVSSSVAHAMPPAGQAAQPGWEPSPRAERVVPRGAQVGQAAQPGSWVSRERTPSHTHASAGMAHGQAAQPGWSTRQ